MHLVHYAVMAESRALVFLFSSRRRHTRCSRDWSSDVCSSDLFVERLIGTLRREYLDHLLFWTTSDLEKKLLDFRTYFNNHRTHTSREGRTPETPVSRNRAASFRDLTSSRTTGDPNTLGKKDRK